VQIAVGVTVNGLLVLAAGSVAGLLARRPSWARWQRLVTGALLAAVTVVLARDVPARARA
ncbi:LysE family translocator, partial [Streptomyces sp. SID5785]|nr:LysE family translocator [Streptomyces sp. SID5785]